MDNRRVKKNIDKNIEIVCYDNPTTGGSAHEYQIQPITAVNGYDDESPFAAIDFQKGTIGKNGVNGCQIEDLLLIAIDRLRYMQRCEAFICREIEISIVRIEEAIYWAKYDNKTEKL